MKNKYMMSGLLLALVILIIIPAYTANADLTRYGSMEAMGSTNQFALLEASSMRESTASLIGNILAGLNMLVSSSSSDDATLPAQKPIIKTRITAYTSTPNQTDDTPFITASGTGVRDGVIASNFLPFGTRVIIPSLFGSKIFTVEDRMNRRYRHSVDIWMSDYSRALFFGVQYAEVQVVGSAKQDSQEFALSL